MPLPNAPEARPFYRSARQRFEDAEFLLAAERTTGAIYLAGYGVECMLKALILSLGSPSARPTILATFRGAQAHDYDWLRRQYSELGGQTFPPATLKQFILVNTWTTDLRYDSGTARRRDAEDFLKASEAIINWADGRL